MRILGAPSAIYAVPTLLLPSPLLAADLEKLQKITVSSTSTDFAAVNSAGYNAASKWYAYDERLCRDTGGGCRASYSGSAEYSDGIAALTTLGATFGKSALHRVSNSEMGGSCFIVTVAPSAAAEMLSAPETFGLPSAGPLLTLEKLASGLVDRVRI